MLRLVKEISSKQREWRNHPAIMNCTRGSELLSEEDQNKWLTEIETDPSIQMFGLSLTEDSKVPGLKKKPILVGTCGLTSINWIHRSAEWSLLIGPEFQGKRLAKPSLKLLLDYGFLNLGLNRIWGEIFVTNPKSLHLAQSLGFVEEGRLKESYYKNGIFIDSILVGLLKGDYLRSSFANESNHTDISQTSSDKTEHLLQKQPEYK